MKEFDQKIHDAFPGLVVRKDLVKRLRETPLSPHTCLNTF